MVPSSVSQNTDETMIVQTTPRQALKNPPEAGSLAFK
jgi:hypothetical protein